jgi:GWxTD domain-containing protein
MRVSYLLQLSALMIMAASPLCAVDSLSIMVDYAAFYDPGSGDTYVEFYYCVYRHELQFIGSDTSDHSYAGVFTEIELFDQEGQPVETTSTYFLTQIKDSSELSDSLTRYFNYIPIQLSPGRYLADVTVIDDVSKVSGSYELAVTVPQFSQVGLALSDVELAYEIRDIAEDSPDKINNHLVKEDRLVIPNPGRVYHAGRDSILYLYVEVYGLGENVGDEGFIVEYQIKDSLGNAIHDFGQVRYPRPGHSAVLSNVLDISDIPPGEYNLSLRAIDPALEEEAIAVRSFYLVEPEGMATVSGESVGEMVDIAWYHLSEGEKIQIKKLSPEGQANFLKQFWREMDNDVTTPENPIYREAVRRYLFANEFFSTHSGRQDGWKTARGRVYITYGAFDDQMEIAMPVGTESLIKWEYYNLEGGVIFIFASDPKAGAGNYRLVHSTHPREIYDPTWMTLFEKDAPEEEWRHGDDYFGPGKQ